MAGRDPAAGRGDWSEGGVGAQRARPTAADWAATGAEGAWPGSVRLLGWAEAERIAPDVVLAAAAAAVGGGA